MVASRGMDGMVGSTHAPGARVNGHAQSATRGCLSPTRGALVRDVEIKTSQQELPDVGIKTSHQITGLVQDVEIKTSHQELPDVDIKTSHQIMGRR